MSAATGFSLNYITYKSIHSTCSPTFDLFFMSRVSVFFFFQPNGNGFSDGHGLVTIRMKPDEKGRFGFNVKVRSHKVLAFHHLRVGRGGKIVALL